MDALEATLAVDIFHLPHLKDTFLVMNRKYKFKNTPLTSVLIKFKVLLRGNEINSPKVKDVLCFFFKV